MWFIQHWQEILTGISIGVGIALIVFIGKMVCVVSKDTRSLYKRILNAFRQLDEMTEENKKRKDENHLIFEAFDIVLDIMAGAEINGQVTEWKKKLSKFNIYH